MVLLEHDESTGSFTGKCRARGDDFFDLLIELRSAVSSDEARTRDRHEGTPDLILEENDENDEEVVEKVLKDPRKRIEFVVLRDPPEHSEGDDPEEHLVGTGPLNDQAVPIHEQRDSSDAEETVDPKICQQDSELLKNSSYYG